MKKTTKKALLQYGITLLVGLCIALPSAAARGLTGGQGLALSARYLSDGCFVSAVILVGVGTLCWVSATGFFDIFSYAFKSLLVLFSPLKHPREMQPFFDYKTMKAEKRGTVPRFILLVGLMFLAASLVLLAIYYRA